MKPLFFLLFAFNLACSPDKKSEKNNTITFQPTTNLKSLPDTVGLIKQVEEPIEKPTPQETVFTKPAPQPASAKPSDKLGKPLIANKNRPVTTPAKPIAKTVMTNTARLSRNLQAATSGDPLMRKAVNKAIANGYKALQKPILVVTTKTYMVDTEDKHNFNSVAPYWHEQPDGTWERIDGKGNGLSKKIGDTEKLQKGISSVVPALALAYVASSDPEEKEKFAARAIEYCNQFFINPATRMNPNLDYAQLIPGYKKIRVETAVEGERLVEIVDALLLLQNSKHYTPEFDREIRRWFSDMADWMANSPTGKQSDKRAIGNIGVIYETMRAAFAIFGGDTSYAKKRYSRIKERLFDELDSDGGLHRELERKKPNMYSNKALNAWVKLFRILGMQGLDMWNLEEDGESLEEAILFLLPYMMGEKKLNDTEKVEPRYYRKVARTAQFVYQHHPKTVQALERFLAKYDVGFRQGYDPTILVEPYLPWKVAPGQSELSHSQPEDQPDANE